MIGKVRGKIRGINLSVGILCWLFVCPYAYGRTFYVNAQSGRDANSGRSPRYAWQTLRQVNITTFEPGDTILFRASQVWYGMLFPRGSGTAEKPVVISKYGGAEKPKIHGGHADPVDFEGNRTIQTVLLYNQQHWVISNLEITNMPDNEIVDFTDNGEEIRRGIYVAASDTGELRGITIRNNYIHHVKGNDKKDFHGSGGILVAVLGRKKPSFFNGVQIMDNHVYMVNRTGICISSYWQRRPREHFYPKSWMDKMGLYHANLNVAVCGNELESIGGDGIVPQTSFKALMENNKVNGAASRSEGYNAGLWAWNSDSVLIQYNEVWNTQTTRDGMAFDCDAYSVGHVYQYNYSHDNKGGFLLLYGYSPDVPDAENVGHVIRHNISVNDGNVLLHFYGSGHTQSVISGNLFYNMSNTVSPIKVEGRPKDIRIRNNVFYMMDMLEWTGIQSIANFELTNNIISGMKQYSEGIRQNNRIKEPTVQDIHRLLNCYENSNPANDTITSEHIRQLWQTVLQKQHKNIPEQQYSQVPYKK
jgi:hypothetical protein